MKNDGIDRLSELPDALLSHILSFLETKWAFRTTALSKQWTNLVWDSLSTLHLNDFNFRRQFEFKRFMDRVIARRDKTLPLHKLIFCIRRSSSSKFAITLLDYAMSQSTLKHLQLSLPDEYDSRFDKLITDKPLFSKLEILHLERFLLEPDLLLECENLVELSIVRCTIQEQLTISSPRLSSLTISYICGDLTIVLLVPKLTLFKLKSRPAETPVIHTDELLHLKTAIFKKSYEYITEEQHEPITNILQKLCRAHHVSLYMPAIQPLHKIGRPLKVQVLPFSNLKTLRINAKEKKDHGQVISINDITHRFPTIII